MSDFVPGASFAPGGHVSKGSIGQVMFCEQQWRRVKLDGVRRAPSAAMRIGSAVDAGATEGHRERIAGKDPAVGALVDVAVANIEEDQDGTEWEIPFAKAKDEIPALVETYWEAGRAMHPVAVQLEEILDIDGVHVLGYKDLVEENGTVADTKVSGRSKDAGWVTEQLDPIIYTMADPGDSVFRFDVVVRTKVPKLQQVEVVVGEAQKQFAARAAVSAYQRMEQIHANPESARPTGFFSGSWKCSVRWCAFAHECRMAGIPVKD